MPTPKKGARLGGSPAHQKLIVANLATSLFEHGRITTTEAKARVLRPVAEKLITKAKKGDLHNRRLVLATIRDKGAPPPPTGVGSKSGPRSAPPHPPPGPAATPGSRRSVRARATTLPWR